MADPSTFTIEELTGDKRKVELRGRALPYAPYTLKGKQRAEFTWYPGNATATVQILGAMEEPTTIRGMWKDRFLRSSDDDGNNVNPTAIAILTGFTGGSGQVEDALSLVDAMDSVRRSGQLVRVTWDATVREGILTGFTATWHRRERVEWEAEFTWAGQGEAKQPISFAKAPDATDFTTQLVNLVDQLRTAVESEFEKAADFASPLTDAVTNIEAAANDLADLSLQVSNAVVGLTDAAQRTLAAATTVSAAASEIVTLLAGTPLRLMQNVKDISSSLTLGDVLAIDVWQRHLKSVARQLEFLSASKADELRATVDQSDLLATFVARAPMDLRDVSQIYYDTPDEWRRLLAFNNFTSSKLERGALVQVPKLQFADRSA